MQNPIEFPYIGGFLGNFLPIDSDFTVIKKFLNFAEKKKLVT